MILTTVIYAIDIITLLILIGAYLGGMHADKEVDNAELQSNP